MRKAKERGDGGFSRPARSDPRPSRRRSGRGAGANLAGDPPLARGAEGRKLGGAAAARGKGLLAARHGATPGEPDGPRDVASKSRERAPEIAREAVSPPITADAMLERALGARTPRARTLFARRGLSLRSPIDRTTQAMLLRQLYLAYYEERRFEKAAHVSEQLVALAVVPDIAHQDAARAKQALGDIDGAARHLRLAVRTGPASRKAFHLWTLGSVYFLAQRYDEAISALRRAARWGTTDKPLYLGHLAVAECASGRAVPELASLIHRLSEAPAGQGYGRFVLGLLAFYDQRWDEARRYLESFVLRSTSGRAVLAIALDGELAVARRTLALLTLR